MVLGYPDAFQAADHVPYILVEYGLGSKASRAGSSATCGRKAYAPKRREITQALDDALRYDPGVLAFQPEVKVDNDVVTLSEST